MAGAAVAVVGATASGKTALAVALARRLGDAELLNADSRQVLRGLRVGVNAPSAAELEGVPCHLVGIAEPGAGFTVADWLEAARYCLDDLGRRDRRAIVVGGTGLYVTALLDGYDLGAAPPDNQRRGERIRLAGSPAGLERLAAEIVSRDPHAAGRIDLRNPRRVVRALEILDARGTLDAAGRAQAGRPATWIGIEVEPHLHRRLAADRCHRMIEGGLLTEIEAALARKVSPEALDGAGIGYREGLGVLRGQLSSTEAAALMTRRTLRYAKAQRTWFRRDSRIHWLHRDRDGDLPELVDQALGLIGGGE